QGSFGNQVRTSVTANRKQSYMKGATGLDFTANVNHDYSPFENLTLTVGANYYLTRDDDNGININELANIPQMSRILDESGRPLPMVRREFFNFPLQARADTIEKYNLPYDWGWNLYDEHQAMQNK